MCNQSKSDSVKVSRGCTFQHGCFPIHTNPPPTEPGCVWQVGKQSAATKSVVLYCGIYYFLDFLKQQQRWIVCIRSLCLVMILRRFFMRAPALRGLTFTAGTTPTPFFEPGQKTVWNGTSQCSTFVLRRNSAISRLPRSRVKRVAVCLEPARRGAACYATVTCERAELVTSRAPQPARGRDPPPSALRAAFCGPNESKPEGKWVHKLVDVGDYLADRHCRKVASVFLHILRPAETSQLE